MSNHNFFSIQIVHSSTALKQSIDTTYEKIKLNKNQARVKVTLNNQREVMNNQREVMNNQ